MTDSAWAGGLLEMRLVLDALNFAALRHRDHRRKGERGAPYVNHLIEVAHILTLHGFSDAELLAASILHDSVEDADTTEDEIAERFGAVVAALVMEVTDDPNLPVWERKLRQIERAPELSVRAQQLRVADKVSNLRGVLTSPPERWSLERKLAYYAWAEKVVDGCDAARSSLLSTFRDVHASGLAALTLRRALRDSEER